MRCVFFYSAPQKKTKSMWEVMKRIVIENGFTGLFTGKFFLLLTVKYFISTYYTYSNIKVFTTLSKKAFSTVRFPYKLFCQL